SNHTFLPLRLRLTRPTQYNCYGSSNRGSACCSQSFDPPRGLEVALPFHRASGHRQRKAPGEEWISTGALAFPGDHGGVRERRPHYKRRALPIAKGRRTETAPLFPLAPGISNSDDEIAAG